MTTKFSHLVEMDASKRLLVVYRVYADGRRELFTQVDLPTDTAAKNKGQLDEFCRMLGENLLLDSPDARNLLRL